MNTQSETVSGFDELLEECRSLMNGVIPTKGRLAFLRQALKNEYNKNSICMALTGLRKSPRSKLILYEIKRYLEKGERAPLNSILTK